jgi:hypothetical protein
VAKELGRHALGGNGPQRVQGSERGYVAIVKQSGDTRALVIAQAGDQMAPKPAPCTIPDSANQSLDDRDTRQQHLVGDQPGRSPVNQGAGSIVAAPAKGIEPSGQSETRLCVIAKVREAAVPPDQCEVPDAPASRKIGVHACAGFKSELFDHGRQDRRRDLSGRDWKCAQKPGARQHHREAEPIVVSAQSSDELAIGLVQMEVSRELVGRRFAVEASKALALGVSEVTGRHTVRNFQLMRREQPVPNCNANIFAKHMCETKHFCSNFRTTLGAVA